MEKESTYSGINLDGAVQILRQHIDEISTVGEWAAFYRYSRSYFQVCIKQHFGHTPYQIIKKEKFRKIKQLVENEANYKGYTIAKEAGFSGLQSLRHFLLWNYETSLTEMRK